MSSVLAIEPNSLEYPAAVESAAIPQPRRPRIWTPFAVWFAGLILGNLLGLMIFMGIAFVIGYQARGDAALFQERYGAILAMPVPMLMLSLLPFQVGLLAVSLLAGALSKERLKERLGLLPQTGRKFGVLKLASMAAFTLAGAILLNVVSSFFIAPPATEDPLAAALIDASFVTVTLLSLVMSVVPATVEEILFRGYIQRRLLKRWSPVAAIGVSSLLFSVSHMDSLQHMISVVPLAVVAGLLAYKTNSVKAGMIVHGVHNVAAVVLPAAMIAASQYYSQEAVGLVFLGILPVMGLLGLPAIISLLRNPKQPKVETYIVPEEPVESLSVLKRELALPEYATESRNTTQAV